MIGTTVKASLVKTLLPYLIVLVAGGFSGWHIYTTVYDRGYQAANDACNTKLLALSKHMDNLVLSAEKDLVTIAGELKAENATLKAKFEELKGKRPERVVEYRETVVYGKKVQECTPSSEYIDYLNSAIDIVNSARNKK